MIQTTKATIVEGNGAWLVFRVDLPDGSAVTTSDLVTSGAAFEVTLIRQTPISAHHMPRKIMSLDGVAGQGNVIGVIYNTPQTKYWNGKDAFGYNVAFFLEPEGTDVDGNAYKLEGGNDYAVEFLLATSAPLTPPHGGFDTVGNIRWVAHITVDGLEVS